MLFLLPFLLFAQTNYYISASYNGSNGTSIGTRDRPFTNWSQVPLLSLDSIFFKRGEVFTIHSTLNIMQSGTAKKPLYIGAYGTGAKPVLSGFRTITDWTNTGNGFYWTTVFTDPNTILFDDDPRGKGRYPKSTYRFLTYNSSNKEAGTITDPTLSDSLSWVGAIAVIRTGGDRWQRRRVTSQNNGTLKLNSSDTYSKGYGFFLQNHPAACTEPGDWYYDAAKKRLYMYFGKKDPSGHAIKVPVVKDGIGIPSRHHITIENLIVEGVFDNGIIIGRSSRNVTIRNCEVRYAFHGIAANGASTDCVIQNNYVRHCTNKGICGPMAPARYLIEENQLEDIGMIHGAGATGSSSYAAIYFEGGEGFTIRKNRISRCGSNGIRAARGNNILIEENIIESFGWVKDDNAGINFWGDANDPVYNNRIVRRNIFRDARSDGAFGANGAKRQHGLYADVRTQNVLFEDNIVVNPFGYGIINNSAFRNITLKDNIFFQCQRDGIRFELRDSSIGVFRNMNVTGNVVTCAPGAKAIAILSPLDDFDQMGVFVNNHYAAGRADAFRSQVNGNPPKTMTFSQWQKTYALEKGSTWQLNKGKEPRLEYNDTKVTKTISLKGKRYKNLKTGTRVTGEINLQPFEGVVLLEE